MYLSIDIGTCFSRACFVKDGVVKHVTDPISNSYDIPSSIYLNQRREIFFGQQAEEDFVRTLEPKRYKKSFKLSIESSNSDDYLWDLSPQQLMLRMIQFLKEQAEQLYYDPIQSAIIEVPASYRFNKRRLDLTYQAASSAGFKDIKLLENPIAATRYYQWSDPDQFPLRSREMMLVYSLGGTFDAALVWQQNGSLQFYSHAKPPFLGGLAFDRLLIDDMKQKCSPTLKVLLDTKNQSKEALHVRFDVRRSLNQLKHQLSTEQESSIVIDTGPLKSNPEQYALTRSQFNNMIEGLVRQSIDHCRYTLQGANSQLRWQNISQILLIGGSCNIPYIRQQLKQITGVPIVIAANLELAVCQGGAIYSPQKKTPGPLAGATVILRDVIEGIMNAFVWEERIIPLFTYADAIDYFVTQRPDDDRVEKGAMLRLPHPQGYTLVQVFLDGQNNLIYNYGKPCGRRLVVRTFDRELLSVFGNKELVIVE
jgi:molecular chaperone DnaK (HSP70)